MAWPGSNPELEAISQFFSSYLPSREFCLISELNIQQKKNLQLVGEECLFGQNWAKIPLRCMSGHL